MPVKRKLNKKRTKMPRNVKINQKGSKRASQKKRGRRGRREQGRGGGKARCTFENKTNKFRLPPGSETKTQCCCTRGPYEFVVGAIKNDECVVKMDYQMNCGNSDETLPPITVSTDTVSGEISF